MAGYTVLDVETTGFAAETSDRIVEIAMVFLSETGEVQDAWSSLVNPQRDVGATRIHGITASDVVHAPTFDEIAPAVVRALSGRVIVAHNASFDLRFITHELLRAGYTLSGPLSGVCTMRWSRSFIKAASRSLADCCKACGIVHQEAHSAAADAMAAAGLLQYFLHQAQHRPPWGHTIDECVRYQWSAAPALASPRLVERANARPTRPDSWLDGIVARMPRVADSRVESYLAVLEMAMLDKHLSEHEKATLLDVAASLDLNLGRVLEVHAVYLEAMADVALDDGIVTRDEREELERVAAMLGLRAIDVDAALDAAAHRRAQGERPPQRLSVSGITLNPGDRIVFTGEMKRPRSEWEAWARSAGYTLGAVTKTTRVVVAADPDSLSGKAAKARAYGVPIITEDAFVTLTST